MSVQRGEQASVLSHEADVPPPTQPRRPKGHVRFSEAAVRWRSSNLRSASLPKCLLVARDAHWREVRAEGYTYEEAAEGVRWKVGTVKSRFGGVRTREACQSRRRRQQLIPQPEPSSGPQAPCFQSAPEQYETGRASEDYATSASAGVYDGQGMRLEGQQAMS